MVGPADVEVLADDLLEEHAPLLRAVEDLRERELRLQDGGLVTQPRGAVCGRERMRQPRQPLARQGVDLGGAELTADLCQPLGILATQDAVVERFEGNALLGQLALDALVAVNANLGAVREIRAEFEEEGAEAVIDGGEVVGVGQGRGEGQLGRAAARGGIGLGLGAQHARLLLHLADVQHALAAVPLPQGLGALVLALASLEADQVDVALAGEGLDGGHEAARHRGHQGRGGHRAAAHLAEEPGRPARGLQQRLVEIEVEPVDALDLQGDMLGDGFGDVGCRSHGAGSGRWAPHRTVMIRTLSPRRPYGGSGRRAEQRPEPALHPEYDHAASNRVSSV